LWRSVKLAPGAQIDLVAFSLGGVVATRWASLHWAGKHDFSSALNHLQYVHSIILLDSPVGGVSPVHSVPFLKLATSVLGLSGRAVDDMTAGSPVIGSLLAAACSADVASIENSADFVVNGVAISPKAGGFWIGHGASGIFPWGFSSSLYGTVDAGWLQPVKTVVGTHMIILTGSVKAYPALRHADQSLVYLLDLNGPVWRTKPSIAWFGDTSERIGSPDVFLSGHTPFNGGTFQVSSKYTLSAHRFTFTVHLTSADQAQGRMQFRAWLHGLCLTDAMIASLDIRYS
jgi:pimeloyl-ACP methyl ester carboxylesterase